MQLAANSIAHALQLGAQDFATISDTYSKYAALTELSELDQLRDHRDKLLAAAQAAIVELCGCTDLHTVDEALQLYADTLRLGVELRRVEQQELPGVKQAEPCAQLWEACRERRCRRPQTSLLALLQGAYLLDRIPRSKMMLTYDDTCWCRSAWIRLCL